MTDFSHTPPSPTLGKRGEGKKQHCCQLNPHTNDLPWNSLPNFALSAEIRFLLELCKPSPTIGSLPSFLSRQDENRFWEALFHVARTNNVMGKVTQSLLAMGSDLVSERQKSFLKGIRQKVLQSNLVFSSEMHQILKILSQSKIEALCFKGPILAVSAYGSLALRNFSDLDFLVKSPEEGRKAKNVLVEAGYLLLDNFSSRQEHHYLQTQCEYHLENQKNTISVDLHWALFWDYFSFNIPSEELFRRSQKIQISGRETNSICPEDMLLILAAHGVKHAWHTLSMILDVASLINSSPELDWQSLLERASHHRCRRMVLLAVSLSWKLFSTNIPGFLQIEVRQDRTLHTIETRIFRRLLNLEFLAPSFIEVLLSQILSRERYLTRLRYCFLGLVTPNSPDFYACDLPPALFNLYYLIRPFRLLYKGLITNKL